MKSGGFEKYSREVKIKDLISQKDLFSLNLMKKNKQVELINGETVSINGLEREGNLHNRLSSMSKTVKMFKNLLKYLTLLLLMML